MTGDFLSVFTASFVTFFVLIDAVGVAPIFASLTARGDARYRREMAWKSIFVASLIIFGFAFFGAWLLQQLKITIDAFRAAGGVLLFLIALDMVFEKRTERRETRADEYLEEHEKPDDVSVFPIGIPMLAGPGSIATAMLFMSQSASWEQKGEETSIRASLLDKYMEYQQLLSSTVATIDRPAHELRPAHDHESRDVAS